LLRGFTADLEARRQHTFEEDKAIFDNAKTFMNDLVGVI
jgi:hypothetical protein